MVGVETSRNRNAEDDALTRRVAELEARLKSTSEALEQVTAERDRIRHAYEQLKEHHELLRRTERACGCRAVQLSAEHPRATARIGIPAAAATAVARERSTERVDAEKVAALRDLMRQR